MYKVDSSVHDSVFDVKLSSFINDCLEVLMKCKRCGTDNPKNKNVCKNCGAFLYDSTPRNRVQLTPKQKAEQRKSYFKGSAKGCLLVFLLMIAMFVVVVIFSFIFAKLITPADPGSTADSTNQTTISDVLQTD